MYHKSKSVVEKFWTLWSEQYLTALWERQKADPEATNFPKVGDVVLIQDKNNKFFWRLARIKELLASSDKQVRTAIVDTGHGKTTRRALNHLYPLEVGSEETSEPIQPQNPQPTNEQKEQETNA